MNFILNATVVFFAVALTQSAAQSSDETPFLMQVPANTCADALAGEPIHRDALTPADTLDATRCHVVIGPRAGSGVISLPFRVRDLAGLRTAAIIINDDAQAHLVLERREGRDAGSMIGGLDIYALVDRRISVNQRATAAEEWLTGLSHYTDVTITSTTEAEWDGAPAVIVEAEAINEVGDLYLLSLRVRFGSDGTLVAALATGNDRDAEEAIALLDEVIQRITVRDLAER